MKVIFGIFGFLFLTACGSGGTSTSTSSLAASGYRFGSCSVDCLNNDRCTGFFDSRECNVMGTVNLDNVQKSDCGENTAQILYRTAIQKCHDAGYTNKEGLYRVRFEDWTAYTEAGHQP